MTQEDRELLLKDLCARLPYEVKVSVSGGDFDNHPHPYQLISTSTFGGYIFCKIYSPIYTPLGCPGIDNVRPYLFPLSSMTEVQEQEYQYITERWMYDSAYSISDSMDYLNANHFDYRGLIPMGLAIDTTNLNIY